jgi:hypothetical protein
MVPNSVLLYSQAIISAPSLAALAGAEKLTEQITNQQDQSTAEDGGYEFSVLISFRNSSLLSQFAS